MPKWRVLSGSEVIAILAGFDFHPAGQRGSHIKLVRLRDAARQILTVPAHRELDRGTLHAVYRQALRYIPEDLLRPHFVSR